MTITNDTNDRATKRRGKAGPELKAGRRRIARSRGALSGILLIVLGAWAALVPFIGPYFDFGILPNADDAWHWTAGRAVYELLPGAVTVLAGIVLLVSASRTLTVTMAWLAALSGAWLVVGPTLDAQLDIGVGSFPLDVGTGTLTALALFYFYAIGAAIAVIAGTALGRLSVHSVRDVRAAARRDDSGSTDSTDSTDHTDRPAPAVRRVEDRADHTDRRDRTDHTNRADHTDRDARIDGTDRVDGTERADGTAGLGHVEQRTENTERPDSGGRHERPRP